MDNQQKIKKTRRLLCGNSVIMDQFTTSFDFKLKASPVAD